ncbi:MAG: 50S ribosomal protein L25/general stress protein Ctc [Gammaproteobacteria bacterium]|nr:50S ribosomal protein L25/general stress protein Ctc [Gammaproteobacteria bacterium]
MSAKYELNAEARSATGTGASRRLRRAGKVPAILYGASEAPLMLALDHDALWHHTQHEAFFTSILTITVDGKAAGQAIVRDLQMHPFKPRVAHVDLQRISATERLHIAVPLHFVGQDVAPGVKLQGGVVSHLMTEIDVSCLPSQLPEFLTVDMSEMKVNDSVHLSNLVVPEGVVLTDLAHGNDLAIATITMIRGETEAVEVASETVAAAQEPEKKEGK